MLFKQREFGELRYGARTWKTERRVIARLEHMEKGDNPRYIVTNLEGDARSVYEELYCARGEMENRIKEAATRALCRSHQLPVFAANQFRLLQSSLAYILTERLRALALAGTALARSARGSRQDRPRSRRPLPSRISASRTQPTTHFHPSSPPDQARSGALPNIKEGPEREGRCRAGVLRVLPWERNTHPSPSFIFSAAGSIRFRT
jgi:DDE family transposase